MISVSDFCGYVIAQFAGATAGAAVLMAFVGKESGLGTNALFEGKIVAMPAREDIDLQLEESMIVEYYSR